MKLIKKNYKIIIFCLIISNIVLLFTSANSPLYPYNVAPDMNVYFTVGKSILEGLIPYKDIFDQKGPFVYLIYMFAAIINSKTLIGVYILETISMTVFLFYAHKIISLFSNKKYSLFILPIIATLICTTYAYASGGTVEEFSLPFFMITLYYLLKYFKTEKLSTKYFIINGIIAGIIFNMKFNLTFFWIAFISIIFIDLIIKKEIKNAFKYAFIFTISALLPFVLFNIYFLLNNAIKDFYHAYFYFNLFSYNNDLPIFIKFKDGINNFVSQCIFNGFIILPLFICFLCYIQNMHIKTKYKAALYITFIFTTFGIYFGSYYHYYIIPLFCFLIISLIAICQIFKKIMNKIVNKKIILIFSLTILYIGLIAFSYKGANYKKMINTNLKDYGIYEIVKTINKEKDKSLLNYNWLDNGIYTLTNTTPNVKYFFKLNVNHEKYPILMDSQNNYIKNQKTNFVLLTNTPKEDQVHDLLKNKYKLIKTVTHAYPMPDNNNYSLYFELYKKI